MRPAQGDASVAFAGAAGSGGFSTRGFTTDTLPRHEQFDAFSAWFAPLLGVTPVGGTREGFSCDMKSVGFGDFTLVRSRRDAALSVREARHIRRDGVDQMAFIVVREGFSYGQIGDEEYRSDPGGLLVRDYGRPVRVLSEGTRMVMLTAPRALAARAMATGSVPIGRPCFSGAMSLMRDHLLSLAANIDGLGEGAAAPLGRATEQLIAVALSPDPDTVMAAEAPIAELLRRRAQRHITRNLFAADLTPDRIAAAVGVSRRKLYQVFEQDGGVARYIMGLRLDRAREVLASRHGAGLVKAVAFAHGFKSEAHFSRSFKSRFDHSPGETPEAARAERRGTR